MQKAEKYLYLQKEALFFMAFTIKIFLKPKEYDFYTKEAKRLGISKSKLIKQLLKNGKNT